MAPLISFLLTLFFVNVLLKSSRDDIIYQRPSFANGRIVLAATFPRISHQKFVKYGKSMLRHRYSTRKYACQSWYPRQAYLIEKLECAQRNVTRWIIGKDTPYEDRLKSLKLATLVQRREILSLVHLFKFIKGHSSVKTNNYVSFSNRQSRKSHQFKL